MTGVTPNQAAVASPIGVLGGTGEQGRGLARRLALAGHVVTVGSRDPGRAAAVVKELTGAEPGLPLRSGANADAAAADIVIVAVPWDGHDELLRDLAGELAGRIVVDCVNPLGFDSAGAYALEVPAGSAAESAARILSESRVVAAFHHVPAAVLLDLASPPVDCDVLVVGDDRQACDDVMDLASEIPGLRGVYGGKLRGARQVEALTANIIAVNRRYKVHAGIRLTGV